MRARGWIAAGVISATAVIVALAWPGSDYRGPPAPVAEADRFDLYQASLDQRWDSFFAGSAPGVDRPEVESVELLPTRERDLAFGRCLEELGFVGIDYTSGVSYESPTDQAPDTVAAAQFTCESRYPYEGQLDYLMTVEQRSALYDYYTGYLSSCLAFTGAEVTNDPPVRELFVATSVEWPTWTPYQALWTSDMTEEEYLTSERRCPSEPEWRLEMLSR